MVMFCSSSSIQLVDNAVFPTMSSSWIPLFDQSLHFWTPLCRTGLFCNQQSLFGFFPSSLYFSIEFLYLNYQFFRLQSLMLWHKLIHLFLLSSLFSVFLSCKFSENFICHFYFFCRPALYFWFYSEISFLQLHAFWSHSALRWFYSPYQQFLVVSTSVSPKLLLSNVSGTH